MLVRPLALALILALPASAGTRPTLASVSPATAVGGLLTVTLEGAGFDRAASTVEVHRADGTLAAAGRVAERTDTRVVASLPLAGAPPGAYAVVVVNPDGARSDGVALALVCALEVSPPSGPPGTVFTYTGRGFKGGFGAISHLEGPDGLEWQAKRFPTTAAGTFEHPILSAEFRPGTYTVWATDDYTKTPAPRVTFQVVASGKPAAAR